MAFKWSIPSLMVARYKATEYDPDAQAFFDAAGITDNTQKTAINNLVVAAKANGWWELCNAIYPFVGGTDTTHKFNLKDPQDTDAAFRLTFNGGWTHSSTGVLPNGTTGYAETHLVPSSTLTIQDTHISVYSRTNIDGLYGDLNVISGGGSLLMYSRFGDEFYTDQYDTTARLQVANTSSLGWLLATRTSTTSLVAYRNASSLGSLGSTSGPLPNADLLLAATDNNGSIIQFSPREYAFATIGAGISSTIAALMYDDIQNYQTTLGRQV